VRCLTEVTGVVLSGGRATRMGGNDKGLIYFNGLPLFEHVTRKLTSQVSNVVISANRNIEIYQSIGLRVLSDTLPDYPGPLAGMLSAMQNLDSEWFLSRAVWVNDGERDHPTIALIHKKLAVSLENYLASGERRVMFFLRESGGHSVRFQDQMNNFINVNSPEDLAQWEHK